MIEYLLIFVLGFAVALLLALVVAPAIHRRVVVLTERRMRATVALTAAEVSAEKDAARAVHAMENRRLSVALKSERQRRGIAVAAREALISDLGKARDEQAELESRLENLADEDRSLRTRIGETEERAAALGASLAAAERLGESRRREVDDLSARIETMAGVTDEYKIDLATRETRIENLNYQIATMRDERSAMREDVRIANAAAAELRARLEREEERVKSLDARLSASIAELSDREGELERNAGTLARLREKLAEATQEAASAAGALAKSQARCGSLEAEIARLGAEVQVATGTQPAADAGRVDHNEKVTAMSDARNTPSPAIARRIDRLRKRHAALVSDLDAAEGRDDDYVREEIAEIAAMMVDLTVEREGPSSPIRTILSNDETAGRETGRLSLAERSRRLIEAPSVSPDGD